MNEVLVVGDTHGNHKHIMYMLKMCDYRDGVMFHVGDFGVGFTKLSNELNKMDNLNKFLSERNIHMYVIRGNHDDPSYFDGQYGFSYSHLHLMEDYSVVTIESHKFLMIGGAISVDRIPRISENAHNAGYGSSKRCYWVEEKFNLDLNKLEGVNDVEYVITHSCPRFVYPINDISNVYDSHGGFVEQCVSHYGDSKLKNDLNEERSDITKVYDTLKNNGCQIRAWFYGHFHTSMREEVDGCNFVLLDINEIYELKLNE